MGKFGRSSENGPDATDTLVYWREIEKTHDVGLSLVVTRSGGQIPGDFSISLYATWPDLGSPQKTDGCGVEAHYPSNDYRSWEAMVYRLLYKIDYDVGSRRWKQLPFPL